MSARSLLVLAFIVASLWGGQAEAKDALSLFQEYSQEGESAYKHGNDPEAERLWALAVEQAQIFAPNDMILAKTLHNLAMVYSAESKLPEAVNVLKRALAIKEKNLGEDDPEVATTLNNIGVLCFQQYEYKDAEQCYKRVIAIDEKRLPADHPQRIASMRNYALLLRRIGKMRAAQEIEDKLPPEPPSGGSASPGSLTDFHL